MVATLIAAGCDGFVCGREHEPAPIELVALVVYEDGHGDVSTRTAVDPVAPQALVVGQRPAHGGLSLALSSGRVTYKPAEAYVGQDTFSVAVIAHDWSRRVLSVNVDVRPSYLVRPQLFSELKDGVPEEIDARSELTATGEYALVRLSSLCARLGCQHTAAGEAHTIRYGSAGFRWVEGNAIVSDLSGDYQLYPLPAQPVAEGADWWFPIRFTAELLGFSTTFDRATHTVKVFALLPSLKQVTLKPTGALRGAEIGTTRLIAVHESADYFYLLYDATSEIVRMRKDDFSYTKLSADPTLGAIHGFVLTPQGEIYAGTSLGLILRWEGTRFVPIAGDGTRTLTTPGDSVRLADFKAEFAADIVARADGRVLYLHDWVIEGLYAIDLAAGVVRMLADADMIGGLTNLSLLDGEPEWVGVSGMHTIDPETLAVTTSDCYSRLVNPADVTAARYLPGAGTWLLLDSKLREIIEARIPTPTGPRECDVERRTFAGDDSSFLFTFAGTNAPEINTALVVDNSSRMLIRYSIGGLMTKITAMELGSKASFAWLGPTMALQKGGSLYIVANRSHEVISTPLAGGPTSIVLGTGEPSRDGPDEGDAQAMSLGYPTAAQFVGDDLWVADNYSRRIVATDGEFASTVLGPVDPNLMSAVSSFVRVGQTVYIADHGLGQVLSWTARAPAPTVVAGQAATDVNGRAAGSIADMRTFTSVRFGLPVWVSAFTDGRLLVVDDARKGIWLLDPADRSVRPMTGFRTVAAGSPWGFVGNTGSAAIDARIDGLSTVTYDAARHLVIVPSRVARKIVFIRDDLGKTCEADIHGLSIAPQNAFFLDDGRLAVVDYDASMVLLFVPPDLTCLSTDHPD